MVWLKPLRSSVPPLATVTAEFGLNVFSAACPQRARVDVRRAAIGVGTGERGGAGEHIDGAVAADRRCKHVGGGRVIEVERTGAGAKCEARRSDACRGQPPECPRPRRYSVFQSHRHSGDH